MALAQLKYIGRRIEELNETEFNAPYSFELFADGSGKVWDVNSDVVAEWDSRSSMLSVLEELLDTISEQKNYVRVDNFDVGREVKITSNPPAHLIHLANARGMVFYARDIDGDEYKSVIILEGEYAGETLNYVTAGDVRLKAIK